MASTTTVKKSTKKSRSTRKTNLLKLCSVMSKLAHDAVDKEVVKRFKILIEANDEDITKVELNTILKHYDGIELNQFHEGLQPYIRHYVFLMKRRAK